LCSFIVDFFRVLFCGLNTLFKILVIFKNIFNLIYICPILLN
jgi:hypothetical protein